MQWKLQVDKAQQGVRMRPRCIARVYFNASFPQRRISQERINRVFFWSPTNILKTFNASPDSGLLGQNIRRQSMHSAKLFSSFILFLLFLLSNLLGCLLACMFVRPFPLIRREIPVEMLKLSRLQSKEFANCLCFH